MGVATTIPNTALCSLGLRIAIARAAPKIIQRSNFTKIQPRGVEKPSRGQNTTLPAK